jgi:hypothetical protein
VRNRSARLETKDREPYSRRAEETFRRKALTAKRFAATPARFVAAAVSRTGCAPNE